MFFASRDDDATRRGDGNEATADQLEGLSIKELRDIATACDVDLRGCMEKDDLVRRVLQDIVKCFGGLYGDRSPLTLEELQNYEWPIKDIVRKFRTAGMRDGAIRTLEEARKIYEEIPEDVRRTPEDIAAYLWDYNKLAETVPGLKKYQHTKQRSSRPLRIPTKRVCLPVAVRFYRPPLELYCQANLRGRSLDLARASQTRGSTHLST